MTEYLLNDPKHPVGLQDVGVPDYPADATVLTVGVGKMFATVGAAVAAAKDGYVILVDHGTYTNDFATVRAKLTIIGVGGMVNMVATVSPPDGKAIMTVDNDLTLKNFSFSGCKVPDGNGAGIRYEAGAMTLVNDSFSNNQNGVMGGAGTLGYSSQIVIDQCLFSDNGTGTGTTHNLYIGGVDSLTVTNSIFEGAIVGHELKSRALNNTITGNGFRDGPTGTASYEIDLPNGGNDVVTGNVIEKGPTPQNNSMVHFGGEGLAYPGSSLLLQGNTFVNDFGANANAVLNQSGLTSVSITGNTFVGMTAAQVLHGPGTLTGNVTSTGAVIPDSTTGSLVLGNSVVYTDAAAHSVALDGTLLAVQGGDGQLTVVSSTFQTVTIGGSGGIDYSETGVASNNKVTTQAGSVNTIQVRAGDLIDSRGTDTITTGNCSSTGSVSGNATITTGANFDTWTVSGVANISSYAMGYPFVLVTATGTANLTGALGGLYLQNNGGNATIDATEVDSTTKANDHMSLSIQGGSVLAQSGGGVMSVTTAAGNNGSVLRIGDGTTQVVSYGKDTIWAGTGADSVIVWGGAEVHAGTGALTVYTHGTPSDVYGDGGSVVLSGDTGQLTYYNGATAGSVQADVSFCTLVGGAGHMTVTGVGYWETIVGGSGGISYTSTTGTANITTAAGSVNDIHLPYGTVDSWGADTITLGNANDTLTVHGDATITGSTGVDIVTLMGRDTLTSRGVDVVTATSGANVTLNLGTCAYVSQTADTAQLSVGSGEQTSTATVVGTATTWAWASSGLQVTTVANNADTVTLGTGTTTVTTNGADVVRGGSGPATLFVQAGGADVWGGTGAMTIYNSDYRSGDTLTVHGGAGAISLAYGNDNVTFIGGAGTAVIDGGGGTLDVVGGSGAITVTNGNAGMHFQAGTGTATLTLTPGGNDIVFGQGATTVQAEPWGKASLFEFMAGQGGGTDVINGFRVGVDHLSMSGVSVQSNVTSGGSTSMVFSDGTHLQLTGVTDTSKLFA